MKFHTIRGLAELERWWAEEWVPPEWASPTRSP